MGVMSFTGRMYLADSETRTVELVGGGGTLTEALEDLPGALFCCSTDMNVCTSRGIMRNTAGKTMEMMMTILTMKWDDEWDDDNK